MALSKQFLSGSTNGRSIKVTATGTLGTTIHTSHATAKDEVYLWATNSSTSTAQDLTIEFGGVSSPDDLVVISLASNDGWELVIPGMVLSGSLVVTAFSTSANVVMINGFVNRIE